MTTKEFLAQAYRIDQRINSKLEQVMSLRNLATKATATFQDRTDKATKNIHAMEDIVIKMVDLENEINNDIDALVDLKRSIVTVIKKIENTEYQTLLELRYLCFKTWEQIADDMGYSIQNAYKLHDRALQIINSSVE